MTVTGASAALSLVPLAGDFASYRHRVIFETCKWDPQVGDSATVSDHACVLSQHAAAGLTLLAEKLAAETMALEGAVLQARPLWRELGLSAKLRTALASVSADTGIRLMRFDLHPTADGWALSEVNSDVPGGFAEASALPLLAAEAVGGTRPAGNVADELVAAVSEQVKAGARLFFIHATAYADDRQVMQFLAKRFGASGFACVLAAPDHLRWRNGRAISIAEGAKGEVDGMLRFFPAEWLPNLPREADWQGYFHGTTVACNPPRALLLQSKRSPLLWDRLGVEVPTWRSVLPETRDPRSVPWRRDEDWLVKPAFGRVGEGLAWHGGVSARQWRHTVLNVMARPHQWVAQRRFKSLPLMSRDGPRHLCIGVFTINGKAAGYYGRLSPRITIDKHAQDVAILVRKEPT